MTTDITTQVRNYNGNNSFIMKMKDAVKKYGSLTQKQSAAVEKIFNNPVEAKAVEMTDDMKKIAAYEGQNSFVIELKGKLAQYGKLSDKQISAALNQIQKEETKAATVNLNIPAIPAARHKQDARARARPHQGNAVASAPPGPGARHGGSTPP